MYRFEACTGYYLYPESDGSKETVMKLNRGTSFEGNVKERDDVHVIKLGLSVPQGAADYEGFADEMKKNEDSFREKLLTGCDD